MINNGTITSCISSNSKAMAAMLTRRWTIVHRRVARSILFIAFYLFIFLILVQTHSFFTCTSKINNEIHLSQQELNEQVVVLFSEQKQEESQPFKINKVLGNISATSTSLQTHHNQPPYHIEEKPLCPLVSPLLGYYFSEYSFIHSSINFSYYSL